MYKTREVLLATLNDSRVASDFSKAERPIPNHWATITLVLTYLKAQYNMMRMFGAHKYMTVSDALDA